MREIRFRGYNKRTGWVYGLYCGYGQIKMDGGMIVAVDNRTIGQSTGLKDKTGFLIFDGDIVMVYQPFNAPTKAIVEFNDGCFDLRGIDLTWRDYVKCFVANHAIEIISNIHMEVSND